MGHAKQLGMEEYESRQGGGRIFSIVEFEQASKPVPTVGLGPSQSSKNTEFIQACTKKMVLIAESWYFYIGIHHYMCRMDYNHLK